MYIIYIYIKCMYIYIYILHQMFHLNLNYVSASSIVLMHMFCTFPDSDDEVKFPRNAQVTIYFNCGIL